MRYVLIDLSSDNYLQQPNLFGGYEGEHNETILQVKLPKRMIDIECSGYRFDFQTSEDNKISSPLIPVSELNNDILSFHLTQQLTISGKLLFNVVAILSDENTVSLISKTNTVTLRIEDAADGNMQLIDPNGYKDELQKMVDERIMEINPVKVDQTYTPTSENAQSGVAVAEAVSPMRQTIVIDTPVWETQPTIEGTLNESFKTWESEAYYITLKNTDGTALESGQFKLCTKYDGYATAIDQVFALSSTYIKENNIVDFKSISSDRTSFEMRNGGVTGITIYPKNPKSQRYIFSVYHSGLMKGKATTHYVYLIDNVGFRLGNDATYVVNVGTYTGYSGFLLTLASSSNAVVSKFGYKITVERTRAGLNVQLSGMTSFKGALEYEGYSDFTKVIDNALEEDLTRFTLNSQNPTAAFWFANGSSVTFEEFA